MQHDIESGFGLLGLPGYVAVAHGHTGTGELPELHAMEAAYVHQRALESRRRDYTMGRFAAHRALELLGEDRGPILRGELGAPTWPTGIVGSISHAGGLVAAAVARESQCGGIGLDIESEARYFPALIDHVAFGSEQDWLLNASESARPQLAIELFAVKEAIYKAFSPRIERFFAFSAAEIRCVGDSVYEGRLLEDLDPEYPPERTFVANTDWEHDLVVATIVLPVRASPT